MFQTLQAQGLKGLTSPYCEAINNAVFDTLERSFSAAKNTQVLDYLNGACNQGEKLFFSCTEAQLKNPFYFFKKSPNHDVQDLHWDCLDDGK